MAGWLIWGIVALFAILSIVLLCGKGSFLIAGYNTASQKERAKYDEKKLCRVTGAAMATITIFLVLMAVFGDKASGMAISLMVVGTIAVVIGCIILSNTICLKKNMETEQEAALKTDRRIEKQEQQNKKTEIRTWIFVAITFAVVGVLLVSGDIQVNLQESEMIIEGSYYSDKEIAYSEIEEVSFEDDFYFGSRTGGFGSFKLNEGRFKNSQFGTYTLYAYIQCRSVVILHTEEDIIVVNAENREETEKLYQEILTKLE